MALISPDDVREYTTSDKVKNRTDSQMGDDILRAETKLESMTGRKVDDPIFSPLPEKVKLSLIMWAEYYGSNSDFESAGIISETFDDYSYKKDSAVNIPIPDTFGLISDYVLENGQIGTTVFMRMRRL